MRATLKFVYITLLIATTLVLQSCANHPHDDYDLKNRAVPGAIIGAGSGLAVTALTHGNIAAGAAVGGAVGAAAGYYIDTRMSLTNQLMAEGVQVIRLGDYYTLILPSDKIFDYGGWDIDDTEYLTMHNVARFVKTFPRSRVDVYAYTDNVGSPKHNLKLSQQQARAIIAYLWAHGVNEHSLHGFGYGRANDIADNNTVRGSHKNRRVEIHLRDTSCGCKSRRCA